MTQHRRFLVCLLLIAVRGSAAGEFPWVNPAGSERPVLVRHSDVSMDGPKDDVPGVLWFAGLLNEATRVRIADALSRQPDQVAICLEPGATLAIEGRELRCQGAASAHLMLPASAGRPLWQVELKSGAKLDLIMLRRAALERERAEFPPIVPPSPFVEGGSLVIAGGGSLPKEVVQAFFDLAGGKDAPIVVLPIAAGDTLSGDVSNDIRLWSRAGATNVKSLRARTREEVCSPEFAAALSQARGVWLSGGRQWRFIDAYLGTPAHELLCGVLRRGGVIGGSSAGASIQGQYMPRGSPLGNTDMMAEGYERGLGFLPGVAIDQHFSARRRHGDMTRLMRRYPQLLGIGIDEGTALVVQGGIGRVLGRGSVFFYDYRSGPPPGASDYLQVQDGQAFDLVRRRSETQRSE